MTSRRHFIAGLLATGLIPAPTWADAGAPSYLAAAGLHDGRFALCGISAGLEILFQIPLPARGHAAAAHPTRAQAVAFARRPGRFALVIDCMTGTQTARLDAPEGRHFYGHGVFSLDGNWLYTTENDFVSGTGRIGIWDSRSYRRVGECASGGIGPHDIKRLPGSDVLVVANGGMDTRPDSGRATLNIATMRPNLSYIEDGIVVEVVEQPDDMHKNSIRHLAIGADGLVAFGMQWQGYGAAPALIGLHRRGQDVRLLTGREGMDGYIGSVAQSGQRIAVTSPRAGLVQEFDTETGAALSTTRLADVCGVARAEGGFVVTSGTGVLRALKDTSGAARPLMWDNHLISL